MLRRGTNEQNFLYWRAAGLIQGPGQRSQYLSKDRTQFQISDTKDIRGANARIN